MDFILTAQNLPFAGALAVMLAIAVLEGTLTLLGLGFSSVIDNLVPDGFGDLDVEADLDIDADVDADIDVSGELPGGAASGTIDPGLAAHGGGDLGEIGGTTALSSVLGWLCVGKVPFLVLLIVALTSFGLVGLVMQGALRSTVGFMLPAWLAWLPSLAVALPTTRLVGRAIARVIPKDETSAVSRRSLVGRIATIALGTARQGEPAQARVRDRHGRAHYVMVLPDRAEDVFEDGTEVLLVKQDGAAFRAIQNTNKAMVDS